jgi:uncharacterized membrane protein
MMYGHDMSTWGWIASIAVTVLVLALILAAIVWLVRAQGGASPSPAGDPAAGASAREILDRRLASGEIDESEYRRLREARSQRPPVAQPPVGAKG